MIYYTLSTEKTISQIGCLNNEIVYQKISAEPKKIVKNFTIDLKSATKFDIMIIENKD